MINFTQKQLLKAKLLQKETLVASEQRSIELRWFIIKYLFF